MKVTRETVRRWIKDGIYPSRDANIMLLGAFDHEFPAEEEDRPHPTYSLTAHGTGEARVEFDGQEMRLRIGDGPWVTIAIPPR